VAWLAAWLVLCVVALAGPTWRREPPPFADDTAALVIVVRVAPSMRTQDVPPDRLARTAQKIHDLLAQRAGAKSALIAYAGSAHLTMPLTRDGGILCTFADALDPQVMPEDGDAAGEALALAEQVLSRSGQPGSVLWLTDAVAPEQRAAVAEFLGKHSVPVRVLAPLPEGAEAEALRQVAGNVALVTPDDGDVTALARQTKVVADATGAGEGRWKDAGWWLMPAIVLMALAWARRGWVTTREGTLGSA
jgi:Ca-activated chloride channel family protein